MKYINIVFLIVFLLVTKTYSQQDPHYTMYMYNMNIVNPAYAGSTEHLNISVLGREQWVGIQGAPSTYTANIHSRIGKGLGLGVSLISDKIGPVSENNFFVDLSYTTSISRTGNLSFGLKLGGSVFSAGNLNTIDPESNINLNNGYAEWFPNIGSGILYHTNKFYLGLSVPNFLKAKHINTSNNITQAEEVEHLFLTSGYVFDVNDYIKLKPSSLVKLTSGAPVSVDLSLNLMFHEKFEIGASHRLEDSWSGTVNFLATEYLRIGYAYDQTISELSAFNRGSHEFFLLYRIPLTLRNIKSPRFF